MKPQLFSFALCALIGFGLNAHAATLVVNAGAPAASDANPGSAAAPFKTIDAAAKIAKPGDTVSVAPGLYRENVTLRASGVTLESQTPGAAIIDGADLIAATEIKDEGNGILSFAAPDITPNPWEVTPGNGEWVYLDGAPLQRVAERDKLAPDRFFEDYDTKRIIMRAPEGFDIQTGRVEFARRDGLIAPAAIPGQNSVQPLDDITIRGFTLQHCADWFGGRAAINLRGSRWLVENNTVRWSSWAGMRAQTSADCVIRNNTIEWAGDTGLNALGNYRLVVEGNRVTHCNWRLINPNFEGGFGKFITSIDCRIQNNESAYTYGYGPWFDIHNMGNVFDGNVSHDMVGGYGLFTEISTDTTFINNAVYNIRDAGLVIGESISSVAMHNVAWNNGVGLQIRGNYSRSNAHGEFKDAEQPATFPPGFQVYTKALMEMPGLNAQRRDEFTAKYLLYWAAPVNFMTNNNLWWQNLAFDNENNYVEERDYAKPSASDAFVNNFSNFNLFFPDGRIKQGGRPTDLAGWRKDSGRDAQSQIFDPRAPGAKLPAWAERHRELWSQPMKTRAEIEALNLGLVDSPAAAQARARFFRSPQATRVATPSAGAGVQTWLLSVDGTPTLAIWTSNADERRPVRLRVGSDNVVVENGYGVQTKRALKGATIELTANFLPQYVRGVSVPIVEAPLISLRPQSFNLPGQLVPFVATFVNESGAPQQLQATFSAANGYLVAPVTLPRTLAAGQTLIVPMVLTPNGSFARGNSTVSVAAQLGAQTLEKTATFSVGEGGGTLMRLPAALPLDGEAAKWSALGAPALLGTISDAKQVMSGAQYGWVGPADLNAQIYGAWTPGALQLLIDVTDDGVNPAPTGAEIYNYDAVELFVDGRDPAFQYNPEPTPGVFQILVSPPIEADAKPQVAVLAKTELQGLQTASKRTANGYTVEVTIPLSAANFATSEWAAGRPLKLSVLVDDRDDPKGTRETVLGWSASPRGENFRDTGGWKTLLLN